MKINLITVGSPNLSFAKTGIEEYTKRLSRFVDMWVHHIKENKETESKTLKKIGTSFCILLDETGSEYSSRELAQFIENKKDQAMDLSFVIGGPNGHTEGIRQRSDMLLSLSRLTFPHDIAMMLTLESIYRAHTINAGHPYHRD